MVPENKTVPCKLVQASVLHSSNASVAAVLPPHSYDCCAVKALVFILSPTSLAHGQRERFFDTTLSVWRV